MAIKESVEVSSGSEEMSFGVAQYIIKDQNLMGHYYYHEINLDDKDDKIASHIRNEITSLQKSVENPTNIHIDPIQYDGRRKSKKKIKDQLEGQIERYNQTIKVLEGGTNSPVYFSFDDKGHFFYKIYPEISSF